MREFGVVNCSFWGSPDARRLSSHGKLLVVYLLTSPHSNGIGFYRLPDLYARADLDWQQEHIDSAFAELTAVGLAYRDGELVFLPKFLRWNALSNPNTAKARAREFEAMPSSTVLKNRAAASLLAFGSFWPNGFEATLEGFANGRGTLPIGFSPAFGITDPIRSDPNRSLTDPIQREGESAPRSENGNGAARPLPPSRLPDDFELTLDRRAVAVELGLDPFATFGGFRDYYAAAVGQKAVKQDWEAAWRTWCRREKNENATHRRRDTKSLSAPERARRAAGVAK